MNTSWHQLMLNHGGTIDNDGVTQFFPQYPFPMGSELILGDLTGLLAFDLVGPDSHKFLQGQITQDVKLLDKGQAFIADHCNAKGRIIGTLVAMPVAPDHIRLIIPRNNATRLTDHLKKYLVFSKATLAPVIDTQLMLVSGEGANALLNKHFAETPTELWSTLSSEPVLTTKLSGSTYLLCVNQQSAISFWEAAAPTSSLAGDRFWHQYLIEQGIGWVDGSNTETLTPHQINHQLINAISFKKGCYTGQEVVARMHYKATLKSHLYCFSQNSDWEPIAGNLVRAGDVQAGQVLWVAQAGLNKWVLLAEIKIDLVDSDLTVEAEQLEKLSRCHLPYAINN